jgi:hypothetical protein
LPDASGDSERHIQQIGASLMVTVCFMYVLEVEEIFCLAVAVHLRSEITSMKKRIDTGADAPYQAIERTQ